LDDAIQVDNHWHIPATSSHTDDRTQVLKSGDGFAIFSRHGEIGRVGLGDQGYYYLGTRHLSRWQLLLAGRELMLLNSTVRLDNSRFVVDQTTPDIYDDSGTLSTPKGTIHIRRELATYDCALTEQLQLVNYDQEAKTLNLEYIFEADFHDIFEVRGEHRPKRGQMLEPKLSPQAIELAYQGLDGVIRRTRIDFDRAPTQLTAEHARFELTLEPGASLTLEARVFCANGEPFFCTSSHAATVASIDNEVAAGHDARAAIFTDNEQFNNWVNRSIADLQMLTTKTRYGLYPYAGVPWFSTPFGRDGLITALQTLWLHPELARGVLTFLAATQADTYDPVREAEPGKILHELREGEMAALGEIPFHRYYGTVDATPLFVMLAGRYLVRTGDLDFIHDLWCNIERAIGWMEQASDKHGFITYARKGDKGLVQQGWKDSDHSIYHRDGKLARPPIALCEVQGYAYDAYRQGAMIAERLGRQALAAKWRNRAAQLRERIEANFWSEELGTYVIALDGDGRPCAVRSSNPAHLLYCDAIDPQRATIMAHDLVGPKGFNGWGVRTILAGEPKFNPMSYHNGSVWPHDTALAAAGLARYGLMNESLTLINGLFDASTFLDQHRLPELFCGFDRIPGQAPTLYPTACKPQAWASGAVFMLIEAMLGLRFISDRPGIRLQHPRLPDYISWMRITGLRYGDASVDLAIRRHGNDVAVNIEARHGDFEVSVVL